MNNWTPELLELMSGKLAARKERELAATGKVTVSVESLAARTDMVEVKRG